MTSGNVRPSLTLEYVFLNGNEYEIVTDEVKEKLCGSPHLCNIVLELLEWGREEYRDTIEFKKWMEKHA